MWTDFNITYTSKFSGAMFPNPIYWEGLYPLYFSVTPSHSESSSWFFFCISLDARVMYHTSNIPHNKLTNALSLPLKHLSLSRSVLCCRLHLPPTVPDVHWPNLIRSLDLFFWYSSTAFRCPMYIVLTW